MAQVARAYLVLTALFASLTLSAQWQSPGQDLPTLVSGNERFGRKLLQAVHASAPDRNVVIAPISVSLMLAALDQNLYQEATRNQIGAVFNWGKYPQLNVAARMLSAAFEEPAPLRWGKRPVGWPRDSPWPPHDRKPEAVWIANTLLYRSGPGVKEPIAERFLTTLRKYYGVAVVNTGTNRPTASDLRRARKAMGPLPKLADDNDVWITSGVHLQTAWAGNTFSMSTPHQGDFKTASGQTKKVQVLDSELSYYLYGKTETFEAVGLQLNLGYMLVVLPADGKDIRNLEHELAEHPEALDSALQRRAGFVTMPTFRFTSETKLHKHLEGMGITEIFQDLGTEFKISQSHLTEVVQKVELEVTQDGIRANAETVAGAVYGGIMSLPQPFHVNLDRPFVFLIRDQATNSLLFIGAVMDPSER